MGKNIVLLETLKQRDLLSRKGVNSSVIGSLSRTQIIDIAQAIVEETQSPDRSADRSLFAQSASYSLSGGREDCEQLSCRATRVNELARFALMYSDRVYIRNYFNDYAHFRNNTNEEIIKEKFHDDLYLINSLAPLLRNNIVEVFNPQSHSCPACWVGSIYGPDASTRLNREHIRLSREYFRKTTINFRRVGEDGDKYKYLLMCEGPNHLFEHGGKNVLFCDMPKELSFGSRTTNKIEHGARVVFSETLRKKLQYHKYFAAEVVKNISFELVASQLLGTSFLTDKTLHISFLNSISSNSTTEKRNFIASKYLTSIVPFVEDVKLKDLITLRQREGDAFISYRHALNEAVAGFKTGGASFTEKDARSLYSEVIAPRLASLEKKVKVAKRDLVMSGSRSIVAVAGAITFGLYTGFIPNEVAEMAKIVGFTKVAADILEKLLALRDSNKGIENDELYFLWRVKKLKK